VDGHRKIISALAAHDADAAEAILRDHLTSGEGLVYAVLRAVHTSREAVPQR
jgi:DNA-binding GntR family transcriptional regulator